MFFSIIIPTFNAEKDIAVAVQSVLAQQFTGFELLLMDGSSVDNTVGIARSFGDERIRIFSEQDQGIYDAMNKGIRQATGEWLLFVGSDDELFDNKVLTDIHTFLTSKPALSLLYGDALFRHSGEKHGGIFSLQRLLYENNICHQAIFYRRSLFSSIGYYNTSYFLYADWDLNIRCFMHPGVATGYIDRLVCRYNELDGISARRLNTDKEFLQILPVYQLSTRLDTQRRELMQTREYRTGSYLLKPFRWLKRIFG